ncbi:MAG TPA: hypothetical protein VIM65_12975 [Cyclobacteriaceae bacterium]
MKSVIITIIVLLPLVCWSQAADQSFHIASNQYIHEKTPEAKATLESALQRYPDDRKLKELRAKIKDDEKKEQQKKDEQKKQDQKNKEDQKKKDQEKKDQEKKDQQNKDQKDQQKKEQEKKEQEQKDQGKKDDKKEEKKDQNKNEESKDEQKKKEDKTPSEVASKLQEMKISPDKAKMILEAMKNQEVQYLQQNKRKASKPKDRGKPDW